MSLETLAPHRHPFVPSQCRPNITGLVNPDSFRGYVLNRTYILLVGHDLQRFKSSVYPGKKYLFDVGHNFYMSQTGWLIEHYAEMGIVFDEIWVSGRMSQVAQVVLARMLRFSGWGFMAV